MGYQVGLTEEAQAEKVGRVILNAPMRRTNASLTRRIRDNPPYPQQL